MTIWDGHGCSHIRVFTLESKISSVHRAAGNQTQPSAGHSAVLVQPELLVAKVMAFPLAICCLWLRDEHSSCALHELTISKVLQT